MDVKVQRGQEQVLLVIVGIIALFGADIIFLSIMLSASVVLWGGLGMAVAVGLCVLLYQGHSWARWVLGLLTALGGGIVVWLASDGTMVQFGAAWISVPLATAMLYVQGALLLACAAVLLFSSNISAFLAYQQEQWAE